MVVQRLRGNEFRRAYISSCLPVHWFISAVEFQGEVPYQELWEQEIELPSLEERTVLKSYGDESDG